MRRKFIGALLFGALLVAPTSTFVSCSDYDDEIANLQAQIDANKTEVGTLVSDKITAVEAVIANLEAADAAIEAQLADLEEADAATMAAAQSLIQQAAGELMGSMQAVVEMVKGNTASIEALVAADAKLQTAIETAQAKADAAYTLAQAADAKATEALATLATVKADLEKQITALDAKLVAELEKLAKVDAAVAAQIAALEGEVNGELAKLAKAIEDQKTALTKVINDAVAGVQANLNTEVAGLKVSIADVTTAYKAAVDGVKNDLNAVKVALQGEIKTQVDALTAKMDILGMLLRAELKSLVFEPEFYYHGIEAFDAGTFNYNALKTYEVNADGNFGTDKPYAHLDADGNQIWKNMIPALTAVYHLNPSNAAIDTEDMNKFNFIVLDRDYVRSTTTISPVIYKAVAKDGKLTVKANFSDAEKIKALDPTTGVGQVTVLALQYNKGAGAEADTVITSDYAALKANAYSNFVLNHLDADYGHIHLYTTAEAAINNPAQHSIEYNSAGLDLNTLFNTHYDIAGGATDTKWDDSAASKQVEADGFKYSYDLVGYYKGGNTTSETAHFGFKDGCWVRPQMVSDEGGKQLPWGAAQNKATVGREPLVRVTLTDTLNNLIVAVGYLKFQITERPADAAIETVEFGPYNQPYTVTCVDEVFSEQLAWYEVENKILALLNISKADFEANYTLDQLSGAATSGWLNATLYKTNKVDSDKYTTGRGKVEQSNYDAQSTMTEILKWTVSNNEAYEWFVTQGNTSMDVYIRYKHNSLNEYVCVKFTWTPSAINKTPSASINNDDKISNYWYAHNSMAEGFDDVHINTEVPGQVDANCEIKTDLKNTFVDNKFGALHYDALYTDLFTNAQTTVKAVFVQDDALYTNVPGAKFAHEAARSYNLAVSADGSQLLVRGTTEVVASITEDPITGECLIEVNNASEAAKSMLNYAGHNELGEKQTLTVKVGFAYTYCSPVQKNIVTITNNTFFVKILRPVDTTEGEAAFIDATTNESSAPVKFEFQDWRDHKFVDNDINGSNYYAYYGFDSNINGVTCIEPLMDQITTDMNGGDINSTKLNAITNNVRFTYVWRPGATNYISQHYFGELVYLNNGNTVKDFNIRIPVKIHYTWGTIYTYINASVDNTISNANKK